MPEPITKVDLMGFYDKIMTADLRKVDPLNYSTAAYFARAMGEPDLEKRALFRQYGALMRVAKEDGAHSAYQAYNVAQELIQKGLLKDKEHGNQMAKVAGKVSYDLFLREGKYFSAACMATNMGDSKKVREALDEDPHKGEDPIDQIVKSLETIIDEGGSVNIPNPHI